MSLIPESIREFGWFGAGAAILDGVTDDPEFYPPLGDESALRQWLAGFEAAWWALPECSTEFEATDPRRGTLIETLSRALADHPVLLDRLLGLIESLSGRYADRAWRSQAGWSIPEQSNSRPRH
jgi:hypothetical protein